MNTRIIFRTISISSAAMVAAISSPAFADATPECNVGPGTESTECGVDATATQAGGTAVGDGAQATGPSGTNPILHRPRSDIIRRLMTMRWQ